MYQPPRKKPESNWRARMHEVIFEADTPAGKLFDVILIFSIVASVVVVMLDSVRPIRMQYGPYLRALEWSFTILFTIEYVLRLSCIGRPLRYATSFFGIIDLFAVLPTYLALIVPGTHFFILIRTLRLLRVFRVLKLAQYIHEGEALLKALRASSRKIVVFLFAVLTLVIIFGGIMYAVEGESNGFTSIPRAVYWAVVTMTTVGYGDISPQTAVGQAIATLVMIIGFSIIAVPTGIVSSELAVATRSVSTQVCPQCAAEGHEPDAKFCRKCGAQL